MEQAPLALSNILGGALDEIREEFNELKQANATLLKKHEALQLDHDQFVKITLRRQDRQDEAHTRVETQLKEQVLCHTSIEQLVTALEETQSQADVQAKTVAELGLALAEVKNENAALKELLTALSDHSESKNTSEQQDSPEPEEAAINTIEPSLANPQQTVFTPLKNTDCTSMIREASVDSCMTFCNTEQGFEQNKRRALGLIDFLRPEQSFNPRPELSLNESEATNKKRKHVDSPPEVKHDGDSNGVVFVVPAVPFRPAQAKIKQMVTSDATKQVPKAVLPLQGDIQVDEDEDMEDTIMVTPKNARKAAKARALQIPGIATTTIATAASPTLSQFGVIADEVLESFDNVVADNPDVTDQNSGLLHEPTNRGENDQTGEVGERKYQSIKINGETYTVDRSRAHANNVESRKSWASRSDGTWFQWQKYAVLDWTDKDEVEKMNKWRAQALARAGFPLQRQPSLDYTSEEKDWLFEHVKAAQGARPETSWDELTRQFNQHFGTSRNRVALQAAIDRLRAEYRDNKGERKPQSGRGRPSKSYTPEESTTNTSAQLDGANDAPITSEAQAQSKQITRSHLLSRFQARTSEMQKGGE